MKLIMNRSQATNAKGVVQFTVNLKLQASSHEIQRIHTYSSMTNVLGRVEDLCPGTSLQALISNGATFQSDNVSKKLAVEQKVQDDAERLNSFVKASESYTGNEEVEFG